MVRGLKGGSARAARALSGSLPVLSEAVSQGFGEPSNSQSLCNLAEGMLGVGLLRDEVRQESLAALTREAAAQLVSGITTGLELFSFDVGVYGNISDALDLEQGEFEELASSTGEYLNGESCQGKVVLKAWFGGTTELVDIKPGAEWLNAEVQSLGTLAVETLDLALVKFDFAGFQMMEHLVKNYHWYGHDTYAEFVEEMRFTDPESAPEDWDVVTDVDLAGSLPPTLDQEEREAALERCKLACERHDRCGEAARLVCELREECEAASPFQYEQIRHLRDTWEPAVVPCGMTWGSDRTFVRLLDDYFRNVMEGGECAYEELGVVVLCASGGNETMKVKEDLDRCGRFLRKAERLLSLLNGGEIGSSH